MDVTDVACGFGNIEMLDLGLLGVRSCSGMITPASKLARILMPHDGSFPFL
jgi:hypothetical protein